MLGRMRFTIISRRLLFGCTVVIPTVGIACEFADTLYIHNGGEVPVRVYYDGARPGYSAGILVQPGETVRGIWNGGMRAKYRSRVLAIDPKGTPIFCRVYTADTDRINGEWRVEITSGQLEC
jgi:hypothetical protein